MVKALKVDKVKVKKNLLQKPKPKQKQKQKQTQSVVVNINKPATRKRTPAQPKPAQPKPAQPTSLEQKSFFQPPIYLPPVAQISKLVPLQTTEIKTENQLEKKKPVEEPEAKKSPTKVLLSGTESLVGGVGSLLGGTGSLVGGAGSLLSGTGSVLSGIYNTKPEVKPAVKPLQAPLIAESKTSFLQQVKYEPPKKQAWAELEVGETKEETMRQEFKNPAFTKPFVFDEPIIAAEQKVKDDIFLDVEDEPEEPPELPPPRPPAPEVPQILVDEPVDTLTAEDIDKAKALTQKYKTQENLLAEIQATKANTDIMQLKALTMGEDKPFTQSFLYKTPSPEFNPFNTGISKEDVNIMREARIKALDKPLAIKAEEEKPTYKPLISPEIQVSPEIDPQLQQLKKLKNSALRNLLIDMGGKITYEKTTPIGKGTQYKNKTMLVEELQELKKTNPSKLNDLLNAVK